MKQIISRVIYKDTKGEHEEKFYSSDAAYGFARLMIQMEKQGVELFISETRMNIDYLNE